MSHSLFQPVDAVAARLPFHLNDIDAVNTTFVRWHEAGDEADRRLVDIWTYCFVRRYFLVKFIKDEEPTSTDLDALVERAYQKVERNRDAVKKPERYASWVSVICKNTYLNYLRRRRRMASLDDEHAPEPVAESTAEALHDAGLLMQVLLAAIGNLPPYLQEIAHLRFVKECSYEEIQARVDHPLPTLRAYVNKAAVILRKHAPLAELLGREQNE